jgi:hypothetical protein
MRALSFAPRLRRRAFLIGAPGDPFGLDFLEGVAVDLRTFCDFLTSDEGGAWREAEITMLESPAWWAARKHLRADTSSDFTLVYFAGHGDYDPFRRATQVVFNGVPVDLKHVRTGAQRELIITDSCRTVPRDDDQIIIEGDDFGHEPDVRRTLSCRGLYDRAILRADPGPQYVFACGIGEGAGETAGGGGEFTRYLIGTARLWAERARKYHEASEVLDVRSAFRATRTFMRRGGVRQSPELGPPRQRHLPLAVT